MSFGSALVLAAITTTAPGRFGNSSPAADEDQAHTTLSDRIREDWMLSVEGVTRVPIDAGAEVGLQTPFGLRIFGGYGWVPYVSALTGIVVSASDRSVVTAFLDGGRVSGDSARVVLGFLPVRRLGIYLDASYAYVRLGAGVQAPPLSFDGYRFPGGGYDAKTNLSLWSMELGYQGEVLGRLVLGAAAGVSGALDSRTTITPLGAAPNDPAVPAAARDVDHAFRTHVLPTLTLRIGFDVI
jgi:hypothetical protein